MGDHHRASYVCNTEYLRRNQAASPSDWVNSFSVVWWREQAPKKWTLVIPLKFLCQHHVVHFLVHIMFSVRWDICSDKSYLIPSSCILLRARVTTALESAWRKSKGPFFRDAEEIAWRWVYKKQLCNQRKKGRTRQHDQARAKTSYGGLRQCFAWDNYTFKCLASHVSTHSLKYVFLLDMVSEPPEQKKKNPEERSSCCEPSFIKWSIQGRSRKNWGRKMMKFILPGGQCLCAESK